MTEKQIVTDLELANNIRKRLVDPREIEAIILTTTQDEPEIQGYATKESLAISAWAATNKTCYSVLQSLPFPPISIKYGPGSGSTARLSFVADVAKSLIDHRTADQPKICIFIQSAGAPSYPPDRRGPRFFHLITVFKNANGAKNEIRILDVDDILPEYDATGRQLIEFRVAKAENKAVKTLPTSSVFETNKVTNNKLDARDLVNEGAKLFQAGDLFSAEVKFLKAIAMDSKNAVAHANIGNIYFKRKQYEKAIPWLKKALTLDPKIEGVEICLKECKALKKSWWQFWK